MKTLLIASLFITFGLSKAHAGHWLQTDQSIFENCFSHVSQEDSRTCIHDKLEKPVSDSMWFLHYICGAQTPEVTPYCYKLGLAYLTEHPQPNPAPLASKAGLAIGVCTQLKLQKLQEGCFDLAFNQLNSWASKDELMKKLDCDENEPMPDCLKRHIIGAQLLEGNINDPSCKATWFPPTLWELKPSGSLSSGSGPCTSEPFQYRDNKALAIYYLRYGAEWAQEQLNTTALNIPRQIR